MSKETTEVGSLKHSKMSLRKSHVTNGLAHTCAKGRTVHKESLCSSNAHRLIEH